MRKSGTVNAPVGTGRAPGAGRGLWLDRRPAGILGQGGSCAEPFPEGIEQLGGGLFVEDDHAPIRGMRIQLNEVITFGANQRSETVRTAVH